MERRINRNVLIISLAFLFIFFGFGGVHSFITTYFSQLNMVHVGFISLILIYLFMMLLSPLAGIFVSKFGSKKCMIFGALFYSLFIFTLLTGSVLLIYIASILLGLGAALIWTGQGSYLIRASDEKFYGGAAGFFNTLSILGISIGILLLGFLVSIFSFKGPFFVYAFLPLVGFWLLWGLEDLRTKESTNQFVLIKKSIRNSTVWRLSLFMFSFNFVSGLVIGIIPLKIKSILGVTYIGILLSLYYLVPIISSYVFGKFSDIKGRKKFIIYSYLIGIAGLLFLYFSLGPFLLILGMVLLALDFAIAKPMSIALVGDVTTENNIDFVVALFGMIQTSGMVIALSLGSFVEGRIVYMISAIVMAISLLILFPLFRMSFTKIKEKLSREIL